MAHLAAACPGSLQNHSSIFNIMIEAALQISGEINCSINFSGKIENVKEKIDSQITPLKTVNSMEIKGINIKRKQF